jgi:hypothetical protein
MYFRAQAFVWINIGVSEAARVAKVSGVAAALPLWWRREKAIACAVVLSLTGALFNLQRHGALNVCVALCHLISILSIKEKFGISAHLHWNARGSRV